MKIKIATIGDIDPDAMALVKTYFGRPTQGDQITRFPNWAAAKKRDARFKPELVILPGMTSHENLLWTRRATQNFVLAIGLADSDRHFKVEGGIARILATQATIRTDLLDLLYDAEEAKHWPNYLISG